MMKLDTQTNSNMHNSMSKFGPKCQNCQFKAKFGSQSNSNMEN